MQKNKKRSGDKRRVSLAIALSIVLLVGLSPLVTKAFMQSYNPSANTYGLPSFNNLFGTNSVVPSYNAPNTSLYGSTNSTSPTYNGLSSSRYGLNNSGLNNSGLNNYAPNANQYNYNAPNNTLSRGSSLYTNPYTNNSALGGSAGVQSNPYNYNGLAQGGSISGRNLAFNNPYNNLYNNGGGIGSNNPYNYNAPLGQGALNVPGATNFATTTNSPYSYILTGYNDLVNSQNRYYVVQRGDNLSKIAQRFGVSTNSITRANSLRNPNLIHAGLRLVIPSSFRSFLEDCGF